MKATFSGQGVVTLYPESELEAYAMGHWCREAFVMQEDTARRENGHWRGSKIIVSFDYDKLGCQPPQPTPYK